MSTDPLKETIKGIVKTFLLEILILLFLKHGGEWILKNSKFNINGNNIYEIKSKLTIWKIWLTFPEDKDKYLAEDWKAG